MNNTVNIMIILYSGKEVEIMENDRLSNVGRVPRPGELYKHFKNKLYQIITVAIHSETGEQMVVYQALYGDFKTYVRPLVMFVGEVDDEKYPEVRQRFRFELFDVEGKSEDVLTRKDTSIDMGLENKEKTNDDLADRVDPQLLRFLDADSYEEKLNILLGFKKGMNDKLLTNIAISLDILLEDGTVEEQYEIIKFKLQTFARFESNRS